MAGTGRFPAGAEGPDTGGRTQKARVPDDWQHTATPRDTPRKQPIPLPAPNIIKQDPVVFHKSSVGLNEGGQRLSATPLTTPTEPSPGLDIFPWMENIPERLVQRLRWTQHIAQSSIQWAHHCPALCRQGRPNFLGQLSSCQLPTPFQHGGGGRHPTVWTKRGPRYAPTRAVWSSLHGSKAGPSGLHWRHLLAGEDVPLGQPFESGQDNDVLDWSQQHTGRDWVHHESQPGIDRGERRLFSRKRDSQRQKSGQDGCGVPVRPAASEDPAVVVHKD